MWKLHYIDAAKPVYLAAVEALERDIRTAVLQPGEALPTHRELAKQIGVTVSTASRIYREAERRGLISAVVGRGTFVTADAGKKVSLSDVDRGAFLMDMGVVRPLVFGEPNLKPVARHILQKGKLSRLMQYSQPQGLEDHRAMGAIWLSRFGIKATSKDVLVTAGAQHALFVSCWALFQPGDKIAVDALTYPGIKAVSQRCGLRLEGVEMDSVGMVPAALDALCNRHDIRGLYISGRIQNPTNRLMPESRRQELKKVITRRNLVLVESDPFAFLAADGDKNLSSLLPDHSVYISSVSKAFFAGLRMAYVAAPPRFARAISQGIADSIITASPLCAEIAAECIRSGIAERAIMQKRQEVVKRVAFFRKVFDGYVFESSEQSLFVWLKLPESWKGPELEDAATERNIRVYCADRFAVGAASPPDAIRISLTGPGDFLSFRNALISLESLISRQDALA